jgi:hypothetical protein
MKESDQSKMKKSPTAKGQAKAKPSEIDNLCKQDGKTTTLPSQRESSANNPTPVELSRMAIALAEVNQISVTPENRDQLIRNAYEMWEAANNLIHERNTLAEKGANALQEAYNKEIAEISAKSFLSNGDSITFREIIKNRLLRKHVGKKGIENTEPDVITSIGGVTKAFKKFHKSVCGDDLAVGKKKAFGAAALLFVEEPAVEVLKSQTMSKALFSHFLDWKKRTM